MSTWCASHWGQLGGAVTARGLWPLVQTAEELSANIAAVAEDGQSTARFDPLAACRYFIQAQAAERAGALRTAHRCPLCVLEVEHLGVAAEWVGCAADSALEFAMRQGLVLRH